MNGDGPLRADDGRDAGRQAGRRLRLRYPGRCRECSTEVPAGSHAYYEAATRSVVCDTCSEANPVAANDETASAHPHEDASGPSSATAAPCALGGQHTSVDPEPSLGVVIGEAGSSARREHERRQRRREDRVRAAHPRLGGLILAVTDDPQSTRAWSAGARGEERLAARLDAAANDRLRLLHDRRIPRSRANIDHIAVTPTGVYVIDAKRYAGRPALKVEGGLLRPRVEKLLVGRRDCTKLVDGVHAQIDVVQSILTAAHAHVPVHGVLCFVEADWPLLGGDFKTRGVHVLWPKKLQQQLERDGEIPVETLAAIHRTLVQRLPTA